MVSQQQAKLLGAIIHSSIRNAAEQMLDRLETPPPRAGHTLCSFYFSCSYQKGLEPIIIISLIKLCANRDATHDSEETALD